MKNLGGAARVAGMVRLMASIMTGAMAKNRKKKFPDVPAADR